MYESVQCISSVSYADATYLQDTWVHEHFGDFCIFHAGCERVQAGQCDGCEHLQWQHPQLWKHNSAWGIFMVLFTKLRMEAIQRDCQQCIGHQPDQVQMESGEWPAFIALSEHLCTLVIIACMVCMSVCLRTCVCVCACIHVHACILPCGHVSVYSMSKIESLDLILNYTRQSALRLDNNTQSFSMIYPHWLFCSSREVSSA